MSNSNFTATTRSADGMTEWSRKARKAEAKTKRARTNARIMREALAEVGR